MEDNRITTDDFLTAVRTNGRTLKYVSEALKNVALCLEAIRQDGSALEYVPKNLLTAEL